MIRLKLIILINFESVQRKKLLYIIETRVLLKMKISIFGTHRYLHEENLTNLISQNEFSFHSQLRLNLFFRYT